MCRCVVVLHGDGPEEAHVMMDACLLFFTRNRSSSGRSSMAAVGTTSQRNKLQQTSHFLEEKQSSAFCVPCDRSLHRER